MLERVPNGLSALLVSAVVVIATASCGSNRKVRASSEVEVRPTSETGDDEAEVLPPSDSNRTIIIPPSVMRAVMPSLLNTKKSRGELYNTDWQDELYKPESLTPDSTGRIRVLSQATRENTLTGSFQTV